jgi:hypothetical protein
MKCRSAAIVIFEWLSSSIQAAGWQAAGTHKFQPLAGSRCFKDRGEGRSMPCPALLHAKVGKFHALLARYRCRTDRPQTHRGHALWNSEWNVEMKHGSLSSGQWRRAVFEEAICVLRVTKSGRYDELAIG